MMALNEKFGRLADEITINKAVGALKKKGVNVWLVENAEEARKKFFTILPEGAEVMNMSSVTLEQLGINKIIQESEKFKSVRKMFGIMDKEKQKMEMKRLGAAHQWAVGSIHALTEDGSLLVASASGSQLPAYAYGADNVLWVIGAQKIVKDLKQGLERIYEYCLPLENERALKVYGTASAVNKILVINQEFLPNRLNMIIVKEKLGF